MTALIPLDLTGALEAAVAADLRAVYPRPWRVVQRTNGNVIVQAANGRGIVPLGRFDSRIALLIAYAANTAPDLPPESPSVTVDSAPKT